MAVIGVAIIGLWANIRALSVWRKPNTLHDFEGETSGPPEAVTRADSHSHER